MTLVTEQPNANRAWAVANFRWLWRGSAASTLGSEVGEIALPLFALLTLSAGAAEVSALRVAQFLPFLLATLPVGLLVDRLRGARLRLMIGSDLSRGLLLAVVPVAAWAGFASMPMLYGVVFAAALFTVTFQLADFAVLPAVVAPAQLVDANGKLSATQSASEVGGRGVGGLLVQFLSAPVAVLLNALGFLVSAVALSRIRLLPAANSQPPEPLEPGARRSAWREAMQGVGVTLRHRYVRPLLAEATTFNLFNEVFVLGLMLFVVRDAHVSPVAIGAVFTAGGLGSFVGAWFGARATARFGYGRVLLATLILGNGAPLGVLWAPRAGSGVVPLLCGVFLLMGVGIGVANVHAVSLRQAALPEQLRGRVNAAYRLVSWGAVPIGATLGGVIATTGGPYAAMATGAVGISLATGWVACSAVPRLASIGEAVASTVDR